jgi:predicted small lipoprotein YifL
MTRGPLKRWRFAGAARAAIRMPLGILRAASLAAFLLGAVSCGQTGPLTLPGPETPASAPAPPADAAAAEEDQTEQDER